MIINLVTGGTGFLGSHLIDHLIKKNQQVICIDNNLTGNIKNLKKWKDNERLKIIDHDIIDPIFIDADRIWHLACPASPSTYKLDPINTAKTSFLGTLNMLELAEKLKIKIDDNNCELTYYDAKVENDAHFLTFTFEPVQQLDNLEVRAVFFMELFPTQNNVIKVKKGSEERFVRLTQGKSSERLTF